MVAMLMPGLLEIVAAAVVQKIERLVLVSTDSLELGMRNGQ